jgi:signal peptidase I
MNKQTICLIFAVLLAIVLVSENVFFEKKRTVGESMEPTLHEGSMVYLYRISVTPKNGDIIAFPYNSTSDALHRVVKIENGFVTTKGDNNPYSDNSIKVEDVKGVVAFILPSFFCFIDALLVLAIYGFFMLIVLLAVKREEER